MGLYVSVCVSTRISNEKLLPPLQVEIKDKKKKRVIFVSSFFCVCLPVLFVSNKIFIPKRVLLVVVSSISKI